MDALTKRGRLLFAATIAGFGVQHVLAATVGPALAQGPPWVPGSAVWSFLFGATLIGTAIGIAGERRTAVAAAALGAILLAYDLAPYLPGIAANVRNGANWTPASKILAMSGVAFAITGSADREKRTLRWPRVADRLADIGRFVFAVAVFIWGAQHFIYAQLTASIVPAWMPWRLLWAILVGIAFIAASLAFAFAVEPRAAGILLGVLFFVIVLLVHAPRVSATPMSGREWTSALSALSMCGASFAIAEACSSDVPRRVRRRSAARCSYGKRTRA